MEKWKIGGLKQSFELCQFELRGSDPSERIISDLTRLLSSEKINVALLTYSSKRNSYRRITFCINQDQFANTLKILNKVLPLPEDWRLSSREHVGIMSIFPYRSSFIKMLRIIMVSWAKNSLPIYGIATSLSAISFVTDYDVMDKAVQITRDSFRLPDNNAPIKSEICYCQSDNIKKV